MRKTLALAAGLLLASGTGAGIASAAVSATDVQQMIGSELAAGGEAAPDSVQCPGDLAADVGASITCAVTRGDETRGVTATVTSVADDGAVALSLQLARQ